MAPRKNKRSKGRKSAGDKPSAPRRPVGRPGRAQLLKEAIEAIGIDPDAVDPRRVLAAIAVDVSQPATARVAAARALIVANGGGSGDPGARRAPSEAGGDALSNRALEFMKNPSTRRPN